MSDVVHDTGLNLDPRQREMLEAMGIKVWWPQAATEPAVPVTEPPAPAPVPVREPPAPPPPPPASRPAVEAAPRTAAPVAQGASGVLVDAPRRLYGQQGAIATGGWLIVADMPPDAIGRHGEPLEGDEGRLLDNMLRALQLHTGTAPVHLVRTHRGTAMPGEGLPRPWEASFEAHVAPLAPRVVLAMGPLAAQSLMQRSGPIGKLRGELVTLAAPHGVPMVATYHPAFLLRSGADKAKAWADLCMAAAAFDRAAG